MRESEEGMNRKRKAYGDEHSGKTKPNKYSLFPFFFPFSFFLFFFSLYFSSPLPHTNQDLDLGTGALDYEAASSDGSLVKVDMFADRTGNGYFAKGVCTCSLSLYCSVRR